jgi:hypothetical protein
MSTKSFTAFITYRLGQIEEVTAEMATPLGMGNCVCVRLSGFDTYYHREGKDWHRTREAAVIRAEEIRMKKIASLKKHVAKLERTTYS